MGISVGRLREDTVYDYKFVGLSHNTVRGAEAEQFCVQNCLLQRDILQLNSIEKMYVLLDGGGTY